MTTEERMEFQELHQRDIEAFRKNLTDKIATDYGFGLAIAKVCVNKGWEEGHAFGFDKVRIQSQIAADFAKEILRIIGLRHN